MLGGALSSKETAALAGAAGGKPSDMASMSAGMAAQRDAASMNPPNDTASTTINNSYNTQSQGGEGRASNKVEAALPSAQIFHELFGIGAGGKGSTSFAG